MCCKVLRTPCRECFCSWRALNFTRKVWRSGCCSSAWLIQRRFYLIVWTSDLGKGFGVCGVPFPLRDSVVTLQGSVKLSWLLSTRICVSRKYQFSKSVKTNRSLLPHATVFVLFFNQTLVFDLFSRQFVNVLSFVGSKKKKMSLSFFMAQFVRRTVSQCFVDESLGMKWWWFMQRAVQVVPSKELVEAERPSG